MRLTGRPLLAAAIVLALGLSGCTLLGEGPEVEPREDANPTSSAPRTPPAGSEALAEYYEQSLR